MMIKSMYQEKQVSDKDFIAALSAKESSSMPQPVREFAFMQGPIEFEALQAVWAFYSQDDERLESMSTIEEAYTAAGQVYLA